MGFLLLIAKWILSLRYRVTVKGLDAIQERFKDRSSGVLFLPNHPAHIDPLLLMVHLYGPFRPRPLVVDFMYKTPFLKPFMQKVHALVMPNFDHSVNQLKIKRANEAMQQIADGLKNGENFLLYPSGKIKLNGQEGIGGASAAF